MTSSAVAGGAEGGWNSFLTNVHCSTPTPAVPPENSWLLPLLMRLELYFALRVEVREQTGKEWKQ